MQCPIFPLNVRPKTARTFFQFSRSNRDNSRICKMSTTPNKKTDAEAYKKEVAKQRRMKKLRQMKIRDRAGDVKVDDVSDVEVVGDVDEEPQDAWLNDLIKSDGDSNSGGVSSDLASMEVSTEPVESSSLAAKICAFTNENSALLGVGIAAIALTIFTRLHK
ncbi:unnamed protein product [Caenorhabditis sp. 36 PRJEB53466]|nr:unnamed protein product [Caenorhabditis sp. 36 PRJEB53466]